MVSKEYNNLKVQQLIGEGTYFGEGSYFSGKAHVWCAEGPPGISRWSRWRHHSTNGDLALVPSRTLLSLTHRLESFSHITLFVLGRGMSSNGIQIQNF